MIDFNKYIGIPWVCGKATMEAADCWGLVSLVYKDLFNIELSHFNVDKIDSARKTSDTIEQVQATTKRWKLSNEPKFGNVVMMIGRGSERPEHVGVFLGGGKVLHSLTRNNGVSSVHDVKIINRLFKRLEFYQYV